MRGSVPDMSAGVDGIVGSFLGDIDIVGVGLPEASGGNLHKLGLAVQLLYGVTASVAHTGLQAAHQLVDGLARESLVRNSALYPFGNQLLVVLLEIAVLGALVHGRQGTHTPVDLELAALEHLGVAW